MLQYLNQSMIFWAANAAGTFAEASVKMLVLAAAVFLFLKIFRVKSPQAGHRMLVVVLAGMLILPLTTFLIDPPVSVTVLATSSKPETGSFLEKAPEVPAESTTRASRPEIAAAKEPLPSGTSIFEIAIQTAAGIYFLGFVFMLFRLGRGLYLTQMLLGTCRIVEDERINLILESFCTGLSETRQITIYSSKDILLPATTGVFRPRILLPDDWASWDDLKLECVLAHETAHIRRRDYLVLLLAAWNKCINWFNPLSWFVARRLSDLAEAASDRYAVEHIREPQKYARYLLELASGAAGKYDLAATVNVSMARSARVSIRIDSILINNLDLHEEKSRKTKFTVALCIACLAAVVVFGLQLWAPQTIAFADSQQYLTSGGNDLNSVAASPDNHQSSSPVNGTKTDDRVQIEKPGFVSGKGPGSRELQPPPESSVKEESLSTRILSTAETTKPVDTGAVSNGLPVTGKAADAPPASKKSDPVEALVDALNDPSPKVRDKAAEALRLIGDPRAPVRIKDKNGPTAGDPKPAARPEIKSN